MPKLARTQIPLYFQISTAIQSKIKSGEFTKGSKLPGEKQLAKEYGVSSITARAAMRVLLNKQLIVRFPGRGTFVTGRNPHKTTWGLGSIDDIVTTGLESEMTVLCWSEVKAPEWVADKLGVKLGDNVLSVRFVRRRDGEPFMVTTAFYPPEISARLKKTDFTKPSASSKLAISIVEKKCNLKIREIRQIMSAKLVDAETANDLKIPPGSPVIELERETTSDQGSIVQLARSYYRTDNYRYVITLHQMNDQDESRGWT